MTFELKKQKINKTKY